MEGSRLNKRSDGRVVEESLRLARRLSRPRADPLLHLVTAGLVGFALALLLMPRSRRSGASEELSGRGLAWRRERANARLGL
jgi:hypothetical protein